MRRFSAILAVLALALVLTACGKDDDRNTTAVPAVPIPTRARTPRRITAAAAAGRTAPTRPPSPAPEKTGRTGRIRCPARRRRAAWDAAPCGAARTAPPPSGRCWKTAMSTTATAFSTTERTPAGSGHIRRYGAQGDSFSLRPLAFSKKGYDMREGLCAAAGGREKKVLL